MGYGRGLTGSCEPEAAAAGFRHVHGGRKGRRVREGPLRGSRPLALAVVSLEGPSGLPAMGTANPANQPRSSSSSGYRPYCSIKRQIAHELNRLTPRVLAGGANLPAAGTLGLAGRPIGLAMAAWPSATSWKASVELKGKTIITQGCERHAR